MTASHYCSYCDAEALSWVCGRCGNRALSMTPVRDAYWKAALADREQPGTQSQSDGVNNDPTP